MDLSDIMASSIHDIKNSLAIILSRLDELLDDPANQIAEPEKANALRQEIRRANRNLIQLLILYRLGNQQLSARINEYNLEEFLEEIIADNTALCRALNIELVFTCDPELTGFFDWELIRGVLDSTIGNATRYCRQRIQVTAIRSPTHLIFQVQDDGPGFPEAMLDHPPSLQPVTDDIMTGRTGLGFYFASQIADLHQNAGQKGFVRLCNGATLPGGCFELHLP